MKIRDFWIQRRNNWENLLKNFLGQMGTKKFSRKWEIFWALVVGRIPRKKCLWRGFRAKGFRVKRTSFPGKGLWGIPDRYSGIKKGKVKERKGLGSRAPHRQSAKRRKWLRFKFKHFRSIDKKWLGFCMVSWTGNAWISTVLSDLRKVRDFKLKHFSFFNSQETHGFPWFSRTLFWKYHSFERHEFRDVAPLENNAF